MSNKTIQVLLLILTALALLGGAGGTIAVVARYTGSIETKVEQTATDIAEIKTTLRTIAPPTVVKTASMPAAPVQPLPSSHDPIVTNDIDQSAPREHWSVGYVADHCKACPECCVKAQAGPTP